MLLTSLDKFVKEANQSNSNIDKQIVLRKYPELKEILKWVYSPFKQFHVTSTNIEKNDDIYSDWCYSNIFDLLKDLSKRNITGHAAIGAINTFIYNKSEHKKLIYKIIDKNIEIRMDAKSINAVFPKCIPEFKVALANKYEDHKHKISFKDGWYLSRKLDGLRCIAIHTNEGYKLYSRTGKEFLNFKKVTNELDELDTGYIYDGEMCLIDENGLENFADMMKVARRKNYQVDKPMYKIFDCLTVEEFEGAPSLHFSERYKRMEVENTSYLSILEQVPCTDDDLIVHELEKAIENKWEGLMLRKNTYYKGKRSNDLLKVKKMHDAEYVVEGIETGPMRIIDKNTGLEKSVTVLTNILIEHKGYAVSVGSGFTQDERVYYSVYPEQLIGKTVTIKYFEETTNDKGGISLRFPILKHIHKGEKE